MIARHTAPKGLLPAGLGATRPVYTVSHTGNTQQDQPLRCCVCQFACTSETQRYQSLNHLVHQSDRPRQRMHHAPVAHATARRCTDLWSLGQLNEIKRLPCTTARGTRKLINSIKSITYRSRVPVHQWYRVHHNPMKSNTYCAPYRCVCQPQYSIKSMTYCVPVTAHTMYVCVLMHPHTYTVLRFAVRPRARSLRHPAAVALQRPIRVARRLASIPFGRDQTAPARGRRASVDERTRQAKTRIERRVAAAFLEVPRRHPRHDNPDQGNHHGSRNSAQKSAT